MTHTLTAEEILNIRSRGPDAPYPGGLGIYGDNIREILDSHESLRRRVVELEGILEDLVSFRGRAEDAAKLIGVMTPAAAEAFSSSPEISGGLDADPDDPEADDSFLAGYDIGFMQGRLTSTEPDPVSSLDRWKSTPSANTPCRR